MKKNLIFINILILTLIGFPLKSNALVGVECNNNSTNNLSSTAAQLCTETSAVAQQGTFSVGYKSTFETVGSDVIVTFELLDTDKVGVVAFLWKETPFGEIPMSNVSGNIFTATLTGQTEGTTLSYACKFAFQGGLAVTKYISYVVGDDCSATNDVQSPTNFSATLGNVTQTSVELLLNANDNSGTLKYSIVYGSETKTITGTSDEQQSIVISALSSDTPFTFNISASDLAGNQAENNPLVIEATTLKSTNTSCSGVSADAQQGSFDIGYNYNFTTVGTDVTFTFELLDNKNGVIAFLWKETPFGETQMSNVSGKIFSLTLSGQELGATISYACKFAFEGGLAVTKYFPYVVGTDCSLSTKNDILKNNFAVFPNPAQNDWTISSPNFEIATIQVFDVLGKNVMTLSPQSKEVKIDASPLNSGLYFARINTTNGSSSLKLVKK